MLKKVIKIGLAIILFIMVLPYLIPRDFDVSIPEKPYENSSFHINQDGTRLHAQIYEPEIEMVGKIVMIHGLGASSFSYRNNAPYFAQRGYLVVAIDLPAFGYSSKEKGLDHSQVQRAEYIWEWLDALNDQYGEDPWHLVGHSMGASTVLAMSNQKPHSVLSMNLIAGAVTQDVSRSTWWIDSPLGEWLKVALRYLIINEDRFSSILTGAYNQTPSRDDVLGYLRPLQTQGTIQALLDFVKTSDNVTIDELKVDLPLHLFWGDKDTWVSVENIALIEETVEVDAIVIFENAGHCVHETDVTFNAELLKRIEANH
jgi:pimeloyl-ACP methyl ester carboxylesterase